jgi:hypothetical protein
MITHRPAIDWLTLTTFQLKTVMKMVDMIEPLTRGKATVESRVMQYDGNRGEGFFIGHGRQNGKEHHIFRFSGDLADAVTWQSLRPPIDCSRIDLQLTLPLPCKISDSFDAFVDLMRMTEAHENERGQRARNVDGVVSPDGFCTMYLGSRESGRFYRLYVKEHMGEYFLRLEVEYKGKSKLAGRIWRDTGKRPESIVKYLKGEISTLPMHELTRPFHEALTGVAGDIMKNERRQADPQKTLAWLRRQVSPAMKRLLGNHDTHDAAMIIMLDWLKFANGLDDI